MAIVTQKATRNVERVVSPTPVEEMNIEEIVLPLSAEEVKERLPYIERIISALDYEPDPLEIYCGRPLPVQLIKRYAKRAARRARTERLDDGSWYAEIRNFPGVWAQSDSEEGVVREIETVVRDWALLKIRDKDRDLPIIDEIDLNVV
jgi:predicted RNase H-like HicB family nuclease